MLPIFGFLPSAHSMSGTLPERMNRSQAACPTKSADKYKDTAVQSEQWEPVLGELS